MVADRSNKMRCWLALSLLLIAGEKLAQQTEAIAIEEAEAGAGSAAMSGSCDDPAVAAFVPSLAYTITWSAPSAASASTCSTSVALTGQVNGDSNPSITCDLLPSTGEVLIHGRTPTSKFGGLQCQTQDRVILEMHGDGTDNANHDIAFDLPAVTTFDTNKKMDAVTSGAKKMMFGTNGQTGSAPLIDGNDEDGLINGEISFGGSASATGGQKTLVKVKIANTDVNITDSVETLTYTMTPG